MSHQKGAGQIHRTYTTDATIAMGRVTACGPGTIAAAEELRSESCLVPRMTINTCPEKDLQTLMSRPEHENNRTDDVPCIVQLSRGPMLGWVSQIWHNPCSCSFHGTWFVTLTMGVPVFGSATPYTCVSLECPGTRVGRDAPLGTPYNKNLQGEDR